MKNKVVIMIVFFALAVYGCATPGKESFDLGQELVKHNRFEEAMSMFEDALKKEPGNPEYDSAYKKTRSSLSARYSQGAKAKFSQTPLTFEQVKVAYQEAEKASQLTPEDEEVLKLRNLIKSELDRIVKTAESMYSEASKTMTENKWVESIKTLKQINAMYPNYLDVVTRIKQSEDEGLLYYLKEAEKFKETDDWENVMKTLSAAREIAPDNPDLIARIEDARSKGTPDYLIAKAEEFAAKNDWDKATALARQAYMTNPSEDIGQKSAKIQQEAGVFYISRFRQHLSEKRLYAAYMDMTTAFKYNPAANKEKEVTDAVNQFIAGIISKAETYESKGYFGNALSWYEKALEFNPKHKESVYKIQALKDGIKDRVVKKIAIMDFTSPSNKPDVGKIVTDNLLSYITSNASSDVKVLARDVLGAILKEIEYGQAGIYDIESAKKAGKLKGTDIFIFGSVLNYDVDRNLAESYQMKSVVVGKKSTPNPAYQFWLMSQKGTATEGDVQTAPPAMIEEDLRETIKYKVGTEKKLATVGVSFRVIDVEEGEVVITETLKEQKEARDDFSEGASFADIVFDPLEMPTDSELLQSVTQKVVENLGFKVLSRFQNLQVLYHTNAEMLKKKMEYEKAIEKYTDSIYIEDIKNISSPLSENSRKEIEKLLQQIES
ncbi:MAG: hypothetical protein HY806_08705 [Nitrospirae bacterium]|nr:hypothetical protein [Nitrospirota bacterium]